MAEFWVSEKKDYHGGPYNDSVGPVTGHYTAMVWKSTTDVGCGFAYNNKTDFLSCRYIPAGNFNGQMPY
jgi:pathogenesis-related protein 1